MAVATNAQKINCHDCGKELTLDRKKNILNGLRLVYDNQGEKTTVFKCHQCYRKDASLKNYQACEVYSRVVGYLRPINQWNYGKQKEFDYRKEYKIKRSA